MGMRVPEGLSSALDSLVSSPSGRKVLASALVAAAGAAAAALAKASDDDGDDREDGDRDDGRSERRSVRTTTKNVGLAAAGVALAEMATGAVQSMLPAGSESRGNEDS
jgi:hypothetical protein